MPGSKLLFVSYDGLIADIAWQVSREGHQAKLWIQYEDERVIADGFAAKCDDWRREVDWADVVVFDVVLGMGAWADELFPRLMMKKGGLFVIFVIPLKQQVG